MKYKFTYKVEPFADMFHRTIVAPYYEEAVRLWKKSILSYHAILLDVQEATMINKRCKGCKHLASSICWSCQDGDHFAADEDEGRD